jgi:DNA repair protein SbcD/Mre11
MSDFRFIHAADWHLGSPLQKLESYPGAPAEKMRNATKDAVRNLVDLAIDHQVQAVLIAGDIYDGQWNDIGIGLWLMEQLRRLEQHGIVVCLIRGNHDAISVVRDSIPWPKNVVELPADRASTHLLDCGLAVHGQSFAREAITEDLAAGYPDAKSGYFNVGLLHTSLSGNTEHDRYAATSLHVLRQRGYDYWALGHIHMRSEESVDPQGTWVGYSGNTQGRSVRECGAKGCYLIDVKNGRRESIQFLATDVARWHIAEVDLTGIETISDLTKTTKQKMQQLLASADDRTLAIRVQMIGRTKLHSEASKPKFLSDVALGVRNAANELGQMWIEKIQFATSSERSIHGQAGFDDIVQQLRTTYDAIESDERLAQDFEAQLAILKKHAGKVLDEKFWSKSPSELLRELKEPSVHLLASTLESTGGSV